MHWKGEYYEIFLAAITINIKEQLFFIKFSIVNIKNDNNWLWFLKNLKIKILAFHPLNNKFVKFTFIFDQ